MTAEEHAPVDPEEIDPKEVEMTGRWKLYTAGVYLLLAVVMAVTDQVAHPGWSLMQHPKWLIALSVFNLLLSAVMGGFMEYSRVKMNMMFKQDHRGQLATGDTFRLLFWILGIGCVLAVLSWVGIL